MRSFKHLLLSAVFLTAFSGVNAEGSYIGFGLGLQDDLGNLTNTIVVDGLNSGNVYPSKTGHQRVTGCGTISPTNACYQAGNKAQQKLIIPDNTLIGLEKNTGGLIRSEAGGPMIGAVLSVFYEGEMNNGMFYRAGINYTKKILGGHSESYLFKGSPLQTKWYDITWDYYSWNVPLYFGLKAGIGESSAVYGGAGLNYSEGGWNLGGTNNGDIPGAFLSNDIGVQTTTNSSGTVIQTPVVAEATKFRVRAIGYQFLIGLETKLESGNKVFFELETIKSGTQGKVVTKSVGGGQGLAQIAPYPISLGGTNFKFGYKLAL
ncbi:MAG: porin OmpL1 [bacterium]|nr:porin OmpL1 [bacterium]